LIQFIEIKTKFKFIVEVNSLLCFTNDSYYSIISVFFVKKNKKEKNLKKIKEE
jgi:hypothetical protein